MIITILAEPRSGSTNLTNWFFNKKDFSVLFEPISNSKIQWYKNGEHPALWKFNTPHLLIKETLNDKTDFSELIKISDKVIVLYRENKEEQFESWLNAVKTNNWDGSWKRIENTFVVDTKYKDNFRYLEAIKSEMKNNYLDKNYFQISYEELYYNNGFQKIVDYLSLDCVKNENFPYGKKYRIDVNKTKSLI